MLSHSYLFAVLSLVQRQRNYAFAEQTNYATRGKTERSFKNLLRIVFFTRSTQYCCILRKSLHRKWNPM